MSNAPSGKQTPSGNIKFTPQELEVMASMHRAAIKREEERRRLLEMQNSALTYTLQRLQQTFDEAIKYFQTGMGNLNKVVGILRAGEVAIDDTLNKQKGREQ